MVSKWKEGQRVRVVTREVTPDDRKNNSYYEHMQGLVGEVQGVFSADEIAVLIESPTMTPVARDVQKEATKRMREKFIASLSEDAKGKLSQEELDFQAHYVLLVRGADLEPA